MKHRQELINEFGEKTIFLMALKYAPEKEVLKLLRDLEKLAEQEVDNLKEELGI